MSQDNVKQLAPPSGVLHHYFCAFQVTKRNLTGNGPPVAIGIHNTVVALDGQIMLGEHIHAIENQVLKTLGATNVICVNIAPLGIFPANLSAARLKELNDEQD